jgi:hypothetical protein
MPSVVHIESGLKIELDSVMSFRFADTHFSKAMSSLNVEMVSLSNQLSACERRV